MPIELLSMIDFFDPDQMGGAARVFFEINRELKSAGGRPHAICRQHPDVPLLSSSEGTEYHTYREIKGSQFKKRSYYRKSIRNLFIKYMQTHKPDMIVIHSSSACMGIADILEKTAVPVIYYFHSPWHREYEILADRKICGIQSPLVSLFSVIRKQHEKRYLNIASGVVTLSRSMQEIMIKTHPVVETKPMLINPGAADKNIFHPLKNPPEEKIQIRRKLNLPEKEFLIITSRRLVPRTGVDLLINAFAILLKKEVNNKNSIKLILTGSGSSAKELKQLAVDLNISDNVIFTGYVEEEHLAQLYRVCDLFVMPTKYLEGFGLSTVEAMASALPVIGTDIGGTPEILKTISDKLIIKEPSPDAIAEKIEEFINGKNIEEWRKKSLQASDSCFSWSKHLQNLLQFLNTIKNETTVEQ